jgi:hypothetical protein
MTRPGTYRGCASTRWSSWFNSILKSRLRPNARTLVEVCSGPVVVVGTGQDLGLRVAVRHVGERRAEKNQITHKAPTRGPHHPLPDSERGDYRSSAQIFTLQV